MSPFERFINEGNEKADELAKEGTMLDGGDMAQVRASTASRKEKMFTQDCNIQLAFTWEDCEDPQRKWFVVNKR